MSGLRRLFRGSGRALAFVFAASVVWLLLDMAALRLSLGDAGGRLLKEAADRGQEQARPWRGPEAWAGSSQADLPGLRRGRRRGVGTPGSRAARREPLRTPSPPASVAGTRGRHVEGDPAAPPGTRPTPPGSVVNLRGDAGVVAAPAASRPPSKAAAEFVVEPTGSRAGSLKASPSQPGSPDKPHFPDLPGAGLSEPARRVGVRGPAVRGPGHATEPSRQQPAGTLMKGGLPPRSAELGALTGRERVKVGKKETSSENHFILLGKEGIKLDSPAASRLGSDSARNITERQETHKEWQLANENGDSTHAVNTTTGAAALGSWTQGATQGAAPKVRATGKDGQEQMGTSSPGTHRVLSMDATLAPRDPQAPGQFGHPVSVPDDKQEEAKSRWKEGNFNVYLSDLIPVDRAIVDTRPAGCSDQHVHDDLPNTSIIMCFVDEVWSTLLRSVHSILSRSPPHLIEEVILVDDFSTKKYLKEKLDKYMSRFPKVKILHLKERHGLIRARLAGAEIAKGTILTFLDSHVECNVGWLEPLLERVRLSRTKVACPVIEVISDKDMSYMTVDNFQRGIFTWPMNFGWKQIPQEIIEKNKIKETDIIRCPVMAGGLFSIDKKYFFELGMYDPGLDVWGGENMEISFKVWMCGGEIEIVPCSRVGHIFRNDNPYSFPKDRVRTVERNLARVAEVWLDEYKELFYGHAYHLILKNVDVGDLTQQIQLRKKLQCKSFQWYLENVYPDLEAPLVKASGLLVNKAMARCITVENTTLAFEACDVNNKNQKFNYTWLRLIQHGELCIAQAGTVEALGLRHCEGRSRSLAWLHRSLAAFQPELKDHIISEHLQQLACLEVDPSHKALRVNACDSANLYQKWQFGNYYAD
ncbi:polypeptide N-acetylgalactosaminyltransferase 5 isoform X1 [Pezoporus flaviventris]|uniref:polypeptide N-acetylgalactosaminyltransferase 5 isoform X1 n=1 Tax=Pezoporus flaviventris TaxID=889875 RepID=UPI002AB090DE|nr:polypeptide N-acetylgalactosaminyltransferase 5 isoform X1 [Pezoporus flaviventris]